MMRLDVWLWAVRVFKTRRLSLEAIKAENVEIEGQPCKPARLVRAGDCVAIRLDSEFAVWTRTLRVLGSPPSRVGAKLVPQYAEELTSNEEFEKARTRPHDLIGFRPRGAGRPTKRDRREIERMHPEDGG